MNLKSMSIDQLISLRGRVDATLSRKVTNERHTLGSKLAHFTRSQGGAMRSKVAAQGGLRGAVAPKYRNPENRTQTWAGRGLKPKWLTAAIKAGKKQDDFLIAGAAKSSKINGRKKTRRARK